jgi:hypothetical protein
MAFNLFKKKKYEKVPENIKKIKSSTEKERRKYQYEREAQANIKIAKYEERQRQYANTRSGRLGMAIQKGFALTRPEGVARALYSKSIRPRLARNPYEKKRGRYVVKQGMEGIGFGERQTFIAPRTGKTGRPVGTVKYRDPRTGQPIGVYEYRKILSAQLRNEKLAILQRSVVNPQQQAYLDALRRRQEYEAGNEEGKIIPNTHGQVNLQSIHDEANAYAHLVD